jgi:DNA-binding CsgD family transcriptional regulator
MLRMRTVRAAERSVHDLDLLSVAGLDLVGFLGEAMSVLGTAIPEAAACVATHDPLSGLLTGIRKYGDLVGRNQHDALYGRLEGSAEEATSYRALVRRQVPAVGMALHTKGDVRASVRMRELVVPHFGYGDEARLVMREGRQHWGVLSLFRPADEKPFSRTEIAVLSRFSASFARGIRNGILLQTPRPRDAQAAGGAIVVVNPDDRVAQITPRAQAHLEQLRRDRHSGSPSAVIASLASTARTHAAAGSEELVFARVRGADGVWLTLHAVVLHRDDGRSEQVAITVEESQPAEILEVAMAAHGLTPRERTVLRLVIEGRETAEMARTLRLSPHTVNHHLRALFAKTKVHSRGQLVATLLGDSYTAGRVAPGRAEPPIVGGTGQAPSQ